MSRKWKRWTGTKVLVHLICSAAAWQRFVQSGHIWLVSHRLTTTMDHYMGWIYTHWPLYRVHLYNLMWSNAAAQQWIQLLQGYNNSTTRLVGGGVELECITLRGVSNVSGLSFPVCKLGGQNIRWAKWTLQVYSSEQNKKKAAQGSYSSLHSSVPNWSLAVRLPVARSGTL